jgi:hypothetical protein
MAESDPIAPLPNADPKVLARFLAKVDRTGECWIWTGGKRRGGYGETRFNGRTQVAGRVALELFIGPVPDGLFVLHSCDNPPCVRPSHLFTGTHADNAADKVAKGRQVSGNRHWTRLHPERLARGAANGKTRNAKLTPEKVHEIRSSDESSAAVAKRLGISRTTASDARSGKTWAHVPYQ